MSLSEKAENASINSSCSVFRCSKDNDDVENHIVVSPKTSIEINGVFEQGDSWVTAMATLSMEDHELFGNSNASFDSNTENAKLRGLVRAFSLLVGARETASHQNKEVRER
jgi:hypothetical protein